MHWLSLMLSYFLGKLNFARPPSIKETALQILDEATFRSRKPITLLLAGLACVLFFCGGFFLSLIDFTTQFDREGALLMSARAGSGLILVTLSSGILVWIFTQAWPGVQRKNLFKTEPPSPPKQNTLEQALALLVMDFIKERENKRQASTGAPPPSAPTEKDESPLYHH